MSETAYSQTPAPCSTCSGPVLARDNKWECSVCGLLTDYNTGESGVSRGQPSKEKPRVIVINGYAENPDLRTPAASRSELAVLLEEEAEQEAKALAGAVQQELATVAVMDKPPPAHQPIRSGKRR